VEDGMSISVHTATKLMDVHDLWHATASPARYGVGDAVVWHSTTWG
jgi:hypothetical protein